MEYFNLKYKNLNFFNALDKLDRYRNKKALMPWIIIVLRNFILGDYDIRDKAAKINSKLVVRTQGGKR